MAAIEAPGMIARIPLIGKLSSAALPFQSYFVFGHVSYMECGQALGNRLFFRGRPGKLTDVVGKFTWRCAAANPPYALLNGSWRKFVFWLGAAAMTLIFCWPLAVKRPMA